MFPRKLQASSRTYALASFDHSLLAVFSRDRDLYSHQILCPRRPADPLPLLASTAADKTEPIPSSPPLQALNVDELGSPSQPAIASAKLIGASNDKHWSVSLSPVEGRASTLLYQGHCRLRTLLPELRTSYRAPAAELLERSNQAALFRTHGVQWSVTILPVSGAWRPAFCRLDLPKPQESSRNPRIAVVCEPAMTDEPPLQLCWQFLVSLVLAK